VITVAALLICATGLISPAGAAKKAAPPWKGGAFIVYSENAQDCVDIANLNVSWYYNWDDAAPCTSKVPYVPMQWGDWGNGRLTLPAADYQDQYLLTFNEPDNSTQANMTPQRALQLWPQLEKTGLALGSPAVTTQGGAWLATFMAGAKKDHYRVNFLALHWYGDCSNPQNLITYLANYEAEYGLPIWLTEFSCPNDTQAQNAAFAQQVGPLLAKLSYVQRVAWFTDRSFGSVLPSYAGVNLVNDDGTLNSTGHAYASWVK